MLLPAKAIQRLAKPLASSQSMSLNRWLSVLALAAGIGGSMTTHAVAAQPGPQAMEIIESRCALCHGREGESASAVYPRLAAQHPDYLGTR